MALISCPECARKVSAAAPACPGCGHPIAPVVIEKTAKRWKDAMITWAMWATIGLMVFTVGVFLRDKAERTANDVLALWAWRSLWAGGVIFAVAIIGLIGTRIATWWHHG